MADKQEAFNKARLISILVMAVGTFFLVTFLILLIFKGWPRSDLLSLYPFYGITSAFLQGIFPPLVLIVSGFLLYKNNEVKHIVVLEVVSLILLMLILGFYLLYFLGPSVTFPPIH